MSPVTPGVPRDGEALDQRHGQRGVPRQLVLLHLVPHRQAHRQLPVLHREAEQARGTWQRHQRLRLAPHRQQARQVGGPHLLQELQEQRLLWEGGVECATGDSTVNLSPSLGSHLPLV